MPATVSGDDLIRDVLTATRAIAMVGASPNPARPSHGVLRFLLTKGYAVLPINPGAAGGEILGQRVYASLEDAPGPYEMVDIFRASDAVGPVVDEAIRLKDLKGIRFIWMQLGVVNAAAAARAEAAGLTVVMDRCPAIDHPRLFGTAA